MLTSQKLDFNNVNNLAKWMTYNLIERHYFVFSLFIYLFILGYLISLFVRNKSGEGKYHSFIHSRKKKRKKERKKERGGGERSKRPTHFLQSSYFPFETRGFSNQAFSPKPPLGIHHPPHNIRSLTLTINSFPNLVTYHSPKKRKANQK
jgi:hypothetical protein